MDVMVWSGNQLSILHGRLPAALWPWHPAPGAHAPRRNHPPLRHSTTPSLPLRAFLVPCPIPPCLPPLRHQRLWLLRLVGHRQVDVEGRSAAGLGGERDRRPEHLGQFAADRQTEPRAGVLARVAGIDLAELLEDHILHVLGDARPRVGHADAHPERVVLPGDPRSGVPGLRETPFQGATAAAMPSGGAGRR